MAIRDKKIGAIERMLKNSVYAPDSRMVQSLDKCLAVLSLTTLQNLEIIIRTRIDDALRIQQDDTVEGTRSGITVNRWRVGHARGNGAEGR